MRKDNSPVLMESMVKADMLPCYRAQDRDRTAMITSGDTEAHIKYMVKTCLTKVHLGDDACMSFPTSTMPLILKIILYSQ